jgi:hypothetical protein
MKKAYIYFLVPLIGLVAFGGVYWKFNAGYEQRQLDRAAAERAKKDAKLKEDQLNREKAVAEAKIAQDKRKAEKAAKDAREAKEAEEREAAIQARRKAQSDAEKAEAQVVRLKKDVADTNEEIKKIDDEKRRAATEIAFLKDFVKQQEANRIQLQGVLEKIELADKAAAAAAQAAAQKK